ncbi:hypothetical protein D3C85_1857200 [compost metagenome]
MITVTQEPTLSASRFCSEITMPEPMTGPKKVPTPPSSVIKITSPDMDQCTSDSVAKPITTVLSEPASPASADDSTKASSL